MCSLCRGARIFKLLITVVFRGQTSIKGASKQAKKKRNDILCQLIKVHLKAQSVSRPYKTEQIDF